MIIYCRMSYCRSVSWPCKSHNSPREPSVAQFLGLCVARQILSIIKTHIIFAKLRYPYFIADPEKCSQVPQTEIRQKTKEMQIVGQGCQIRVCLWTKDVFLDHENGGADVVRSGIGPSTAEKSSSMSKSCFAQQLHNSWCEGSTMGIKQDLGSRHISAIS